MVLTLASFYPTHPGQPKKHKCRTFNWVSRGSVSVPPAHNESILEEGKSCQGGRLTRSFLDPLTLSFCSVFLLLFFFVLNNPLQGGRWIDFLLPTADFFFFLTQTKPTQSIKTTCCAVLEETKERPKKEENLIFDHV